MQITGFTRSSSTLSKTAVLTVTKAFICIISSLYWAIFRLRLSAVRRFRICWLQKSKTLSYSVVKKINFLLSELFQYAHSEGDIAKNPMRNVKMPKKTLFKQKRTILVMEDEEVQALEQVATLTCHNDTPQIMHANAIVFLVHTGLRCGELQALKWSDIDFSKRNSHGQQKSFDDCQP